MATRGSFRIVRKVSQYFYPQKNKPKVMNERLGHILRHYTILNNHLYDDGLVTDRFIMEFLHSHTNVVAQPEYNSPYYNGINPYALGFCNVPRHTSYLPKILLPKISIGSQILPGSDWLETLHFAMENFKDESFISQFLSPKLMRDFKFFAVDDDDRHNYVEVSAIHNEEGYRAIRGNYHHNIISVIMSPIYKYGM